MLNDQTGHRSSETRREIYQEKQREEVRARSAETRRRVRAAAFGQPLQPGGAGPVERAPTAEAEAAPRSAPAARPPST